MRLRYLLLLISLLYSSALHAVPHRGVVVWNTTELVGDSIEKNIFINQCREDSTTDIIIYAAYLLSGTDKTNMQNFVALARCNNINVWAMDGFRGYFADWFGRYDYLAFIQSVVDYNNSSLPEQQFVGIQGDNEPHDGQGEPAGSFHNDKPGSALDTAGGGLWHVSEALDREFLMQDWVSMTQEAYDSCHAHGLKYGQIMVSWLDDYYGEPVYCTYNGQNKPVLQHMMNYLDEYTVMAYRTNYLGAYQQALAELNYAETLPVNNRPRIWIMCETHCGIGAKLSYCDTIGKNKKDSVYVDMNAIENNALAFTSYSGYIIHDWEGWKDLSPASSDSTDPGCIVFPTTTEMPINNGSIMFYPNPVNGVLTISHMEQHAWLEIIDLTGKVIFKEEVNKSPHSIQLTHQPGVYILKYQGDRQIQFTKIVVE